MPSNKNPNDTVNAGPGRLPAGVVPASALLFPPGAGSGAALQAHITNPHNAHMADAIGIPPIYLPTGEPLLYPNGGVIDGSSVLDYINQFKDLIPTPPNFIGMDTPGGVNSGVPDWGAAKSVFVGGAAKTGGIAEGSNTLSTHYIVPNGTSAYNLSGIIFPADRGVLAFYKNTDGNFFNAGATTLVGALWLGGFPAPAGFPTAGFSETLRPTQQTNYVPSMAGIDKIGLTHRLPYLKDYTGTGAPYLAYATDFLHFQLAIYSMTAIALAAGEQHYLIVHWRPGYATSLATIQPANLTLGTLIAANCFSATPSAGNFDDPASPVINVNRHHLFRDTSSATAPALNTLTVVPTGVPLVTIAQSGILYINNPATQFDITFSASHLFSNSFHTGSVDNPPDIPVGYASGSHPLTLDFSGFAGGVLRLPYDALRKQGIPGNYSATHAPQPGDVGEYLATALSMPSPVAWFAPVSDFITVSGTISNLWNGPTTVTPTVLIQYLYNTYDQSGPDRRSTPTFDTFLDEAFRMSPAHTPLPADPVLPVGGLYNSFTSLTTDLNSLQVINGRLRYPTGDFSGASVRPTQGVGSNYTLLAGSDSAFQKRRYVRAFDVGMPRNTGKIRIRGLVPSDFRISGIPYNGVEGTGHQGIGDCILQVKVPGQTGWLDLGRMLGDPGLLTTDFYGCLTGVDVDGDDVFISYNTTVLTVDNGAGQFPLVFRATFMNSVTGRALHLDEIEWMTP